MTAIDKEWILDSNDRCECKREHERRRWIEMDEMGKGDDYDEQNRRHYLI